MGMLFPHRLQRPPRPHIRFGAELAYTLLSAINCDRICQNSCGPDLPRNPGLLLLCLEAIASHHKPEKLSGNPCGQTTQARGKDSRPDRDRTHKKERVRFATANTKTKHPTSPCVLAPRSTFSSSVDVSAIVLEVLIVASSLSVPLSLSQRKLIVHDIRKRPTFPTQNGLHVRVARRTQSKSRKWTTRSSQTQHGEGNPPETQSQSTRLWSACGNNHGCSSHKSCVRALRFGENRRNDVRGRSVNSVIVLAPLSCLTDSGTSCVVVENVRWHLG